MDFIFKIILGFHVLGGSIGLLTGTVNLLRKKGDKRHRKTGILFTYSMLMAGFTSLALSLIHPNNFLFMVGVFTLYMTSSGVRYLKLNPIAQVKKPKFLDWLIAGAMLLAGLWFIGFGISELIHSNSFGLVHATFGLVGLLFVRQDYRHFTDFSLMENYWMRAHIGRITGAYIASLTAFLVVNGENLPIKLPAFVIWLLPTFIIVPFISRWTRKYKIKKMASGK